MAFNGNCSIGNNSYISIGKNGKLVFGDRFCASTTLRIIAWHSVIFENNVLFGWDNMVMDTDFHKLTKESGGFSRGFAPIHIGANNWFGTGCRVMKRTQTPDYCTISAGTMLSGPVDVPERSVIGSSNDITVKATGLWRDIDNDEIDYTK